LGQARYTAPRLWPCDHRRAPPPRPLPQANSRQWNAGFFCGARTCARTSIPPSVPPTDRHLALDLTFRPHAETRASPAQAWRHVDRPTAQIYRAPRQSVSECAVHAAGTSALGHHALLHCCHRRHLGQMCPDDTLRGSTTALLTQGTAHTRFLQAMGLQADVSVACSADPLPQVGQPEPEQEDE
jgi:hypothetical protein